MTSLRQSAGDRGQGRVAHAPPRPLCGAASGQCGLSERPAEPVTFSGTSEWL